MTTSPSPEAVAEAFSSHRFSKAYPHIAEDVRWTLVGGPTLVGKSAAVAACEDTLSQLAETTTRFQKFKIITGGDSVVIDSVAEYETPGQVTSVVASCDIYEFRDGVISELTSYTVELEEP